MNDEQFIVVWIMSFLLYLVIYTFWIPLKTNMTKDLSGQPWYVQAAASKLLPIIQNATNKQSGAVDTVSKGLGMGK